MFCSLNTEQCKYNTNKNVFHQRLWPWATAGDHVQHLKTSHAVNVGLKWTEGINRNVKIWITNKAKQGTNILNTLGRQWELRRRMLSLHFWFLLRPFPSLLGCYLHCTLSLCLFLSCQGNMEGWKETRQGQRSCLVLMTLISCQSDFRVSEGMFGLWICPDTR